MDYAIHTTGPALTVEVSCEELLAPVDQNLQIITNAHSNMSTTDKETLWPLVKAVLAATDKPILINMFHDLAAVLNTVADVHKAEVMALNLGMVAHFDSGVKKQTIQVPGLVDKLGHSLEDTVTFVKDTEMGNDDDQLEDDSASDSASDSSSDSSNEIIEIIESPTLGPRKRGRKTISEVVEGPDSIDHSFIVADYEKKIGLTINIDDIVGADYMEELRRKVFLKLNNYPITTTSQSRSVTSHLLPVRAFTISKAFFKDMVNPLCQRVHDIIMAQANLTGTAAEAASAKAELPDSDSTTPRVLRDMHRVLAALLKSNAKTGAIIMLQHQIELSRLASIWGEIKLMVETRPLTPEASMLLARCPPPSRGVNNRSRATAGICNSMGMKVDTFQLYIRNSKIPAALVQVFGNGGIMFAKPAISGGRSKNIQGSEARQIFEVIKLVDTKFVLQQIANRLDEVVVNYMWENKPFPWDAQSLGGLDSKMDLIPLLKAIHDTIED